ncbi:hypothetical protein Acr_07g0009780 [Actinidia rufa]|uniref:Uncharacterized protein n=1 Tax=Actinidia rufa TaxID=165716 RepID=A0A7J0EWC8_9ERIC|nr:hypothetical protein Acr_07g0009780 [Actinidia rufa]
MCYGPQRLLYVVDDLNLTRTRPPPATEATVVDLRHRLAATEASMVRARTREADLTRHLNEMKRFVSVMEIIETYLKRRVHEQQEESFVSCLRPLHPEPMRFNGLKGTGVQLCKEGGASGRWLVRDIEDHDQEHEMLTGMLSEGDNWEGVNFAIVPFEHNQIEHIASVGPKDEDNRLDDVGDWFSDRGVDSGERVETAAGAKGRGSSRIWNGRRPKGIGKEGGAVGLRGTRSVVCLQETKLKEVDGTIIKSFWGGRCVKWECLRAVGSVRGILMMWNSSQVSCLNFLQGFHTISCLFKNVEDGYIWAFARVYGPHNRRDRLRMWEELSGARGIGSLGVMGQLHLGGRIQGFCQQVVGRIRSFWVSIISPSQEATIVEGRLEEVEQGGFGRVEIRLTTLMDEIQVLDTNETLLGLSEIKVEGVLHEDQTSVSYGIVGYYKKLYKEPEQWRSRVDGLMFPSLNSEDVDSLVGDGIDMRRLVKMLGCKSRSLPTKYLDLPLGSPFKSKVVWGTVVNRLERRLASWKRQYLFKGGKLTLIKSSLSSMSTYFLSLLTIPKSITSRLEKLMRLSYGMI